MIAVGIAIAAIVVCLAVGGRLYRRSVAEKAMRLAPCALRRQWQKGVDVDPATIILWASIVVVALAALGAFSAKRKSK